MAPFDLDALLAVDRSGWMEELDQITEYLAQFGDRLPTELMEELDETRSNLSQTARAD